MWFFRLLSWLPFWALYGLADFLAWVAGKVLKYRGKVIDRNLQKSFPEKNEDERAQIKQGFYKSLADVVVESIKTISISKAEMRNRVVLNNEHLLKQYYTEGQGVIVLAGHQANWEWCLVGFDAAVNMKIDGVYRPLHNQFFDALMIKIRGRFGANPLKADDTSSHLKRNRLDARILALVADQTPSAKGATVLQFLGQPTAFFRGPELMATISGWPVLYAEMVRIARGKYQINFYSVLEVGENVRLIVPRYAELLESSIRRNPEQWLWSHRRWKHKVSLQSST